MISEVEAGKLVRVRNTHTGDVPWVVELYCKRTPVLVVQTDVGGPLGTGHCTILHEGQRRLFQKSRLEVVSK